MFLDKAKIKIQSGDGGNGMVAWRREKYVDMGGPAGGDGGEGGNVYIEADAELSTLMDFKFKSIFKANNGDNGRSKNQHGKCAKDLVIKVPLGTVVKESLSGKAIADLVHQDDRVLVAQGGRGGRGNARFATSSKRSPQFCEPGECGIERDLELELKLIADVGLLGMPNAGKSTFISVISSAKPKIADYPFTTLVPNLGVVKKPYGDAFVVADIPGLIEGASKGVGLGHEFLRHVERCRFLVHLVDISAEAPVDNYKKINKELKKYGTRLSDTYQIIALTKTDLLFPEEVEAFVKKFKKYSKDVYMVSSVTSDGVKPLLDFITQKVDEIEKPIFEVDVQEDLVATDNDDSDYQVYKADKSTFVIEGGKVHRLANVTDTRNNEQLSRFLNILSSMGVFESLKQTSIKEGDTVKVGHIEFIYYAD